MELADDNIKFIHIRDKHNRYYAMLCNEQKQNNMCKMLASQKCHSNKNSSKSFTLSADGVLQKHQ